MSATEGGASAGAGGAVGLKIYPRGGGFVDEIRCPPKSRCGQFSCVHWTGGGCGKCCGYLARKAASLSAFFLFSNPLCLLRNSLIDSLPHLMQLGPCSHNLDSSTARALDCRC